MARQSPWIRGGTARYRELERVEVVGAADDIDIESPEVPIDEVWYLPAISLITSDTGVARNARFELRRPAGVSGPIIGHGSVTGEVIPVEVGRAFYLGPGWVIAASVNALTLGTNLTLRFSRIRVPIGEILPSI